MKRKYTFYVYDRRTQLTEFVAAFAVRAHAVEWGRATFGDHAFVVDRACHVAGQMWDGLRPEDRKKEEIACE